MRALSTALLALAVFSPLAWAQQIIGLGAFGPGSGSRAWAVSDDGKAVAGTTYFEFGPTLAFRWASGVTVLIEPPQGMDACGATGVSNDGSIVVGWAQSDPPYREAAFRWSYQGGTVDLGTLPGDTDASATGISGDGSVVVGYSSIGGGWARAFQWTEGAGMTPLPLLPGGTFSVAMGISRDGSTIAGYADSSQGLFAVRWRGAQVEALGPPALPNTNMMAWGTSADGSVVFGRGSHGVFRWTAESGMQPLGNYSERLSTALCSDLHGTLMGGCTSDVWLAEEALIWTQGTGLVGARSFLASQGVDVSRWWLAACDAMSPDGRHIVGGGCHWISDTQCRGEGFLVTLPPCGARDFDQDGDPGTDQDIQAFLACLAGDCCATCDRHGADFDGDGAPGTDLDIECFFRVLAGGPC
jgi:probable HAF family extracellular repeat protein